MATEITTANHIQYDEEFTSDGVAELPYFLQNTTNFSKLVEWSCKRWAAMDEEVIKLAYMRLLENAEGEIVDMLGERLGLSRSGQSDDEYKGLINLRSYRQTVSDNRTDIVTLLGILFAGNTDAIISKNQSNFIEVIIPEHCLSDEYISDQIEDMFPINTSLMITQSDGDPFYFVDLKDGIQRDNTGGLSDLKESVDDSLLTDWIHSSGRTVKKINYT